MTQHTNQQRIKCHDNSSNREMYCNMMMTTITIFVIPRAQTIIIIIDTFILGHHNSLSRYIVRAVEKPPVYN
ncbi:MAG: hypothetical protein JO297_12470 [Nitrososphaeraceae archaeon]|nr:hypothetical protein [Nitrososphaeraceae archaeon]